MEVKKFGVIVSGSFCSENHHSGYNTTLFSARYLKCALLSLLNLMQDSTAKTIHFYTKFLDAPY